MKKSLLIIIVLIAVPYASGIAQTNEERRDAKQAELDAACETARQKAIKEARARHIEECVEKEQRPDRESCERFYENYGERTAATPPLFYDLPQCEAAHEFRTGYRSSDN